LSYLFGQDSSRAISKSTIDLEDLIRFSKSIVSLQHGLLTKVSHAFTIPGMMAFVPHADNITSRMAYVPFVHMNHVLVNALYVSNPQPQPLFNPATDTLSFNIIYTPKSEIISQYKRSYPKAIVPYWLEISETISFQMAIKSDTQQILKMTSIFNSSFHKTICFNLDSRSCPSDFKISDYIATHFLSFCIKLKSSSILTFYIHFLISILSIFDISLQITKIAYKLQYAFQRNCMLRHDYIVLLQKLNANYPQIVYPLRFNSIVILQHIKILTITLLPYRFIVLNINQLIKYHQEYRTNNLKKPKSRLTGGGPTNTFSSDDLAQYSTLIKPDYQYVFHQYVSKSLESQVLENQPDVLLISNLPLSLLSTHISIPNMKIIASLHNLKFNSKIKSDALQKLISEHICQSCNYYTTVFICIDLNEQSEKVRKLKSDKVKQYQASPKGRANNLAAVKNYQQTDKGKAKNIESVRKYQETNTGKAKHIESVKKYQSSNWKKFKTSNLEAVKSYQACTKSQFPPAPLAKSLQHQIISEFCKDTSPNVFQEAGCAVCV